MRHSIIYTTVFALASFASAKDQPNARRENSGGLVTNVFQTPQGSVKVYAPAARGTFSGAVVAEPAGRTEQERRKNAATLNGFVVDLSGQKSAVGSGALRFVMPAAGATGAVVMMLRDSSGHAVVSGSSPLWQAGSTAAALPTQVPSVVQTGAPFGVPGNFVPDVAQSQVQVGGGGAQQLVMTPTAAFVMTDAVGETTLTAGGQTTPMRAVALELSAPANTLHSGQQAPLSLTVSGLTNLQAPVSVHVSNNTPDCMHLSGGDQQTFTVQPGDVQPGGVFTTTRNMNGVAPGAFSVSAELDPVLCTACTDCDKLLSRANELDGEADRLDELADGLEAQAAGLDKSADGHHAAAEAADKRAGKYDANAKKAKTKADKDTWQKAADGARQTAADEREAERSDRDQAQAKRDEAKSDRDAAKADREEAEKLREKAKNCPK